MKISIIQLEHNDLDTKAQRIKNVSNLIRGLNSPDLILLPELWGTGFFSYKEYQKNSESIDGEIFLAMSELAREKSSYIFTGSFIEKCGDKLYNTALLLDKKGEIIGSYRKIHLFGEEKEYLSPGKDICTAETEFGIIGLSICFDLRFPELYRKLSEKGAQILLSCYALPKQRTEHWRILTPARALENQAFFISCGCSGENRGIAYAGNSMVASPYGEILYECKKEVTEVTIDINQAEKYRAEFSALKDRVLL